MSVTGKTTLGELHAMICLQEKHHYDFEASTNQIHFNSAKSATINNVEFGIQKQAIELVCSKVKIPYSYLVRCDEELQARNLNYWFQGEKKLKIRCDEMNIRAIVSTRYQPVANSKIIENLKGYFDHEVTYALSTKMMKLDIKRFYSDFEIGKDQHSAGISVINGETSWYSFVIHSYIERLMCTNGLIGEVEQDLKFRHVIPNLEEKIPEMLAGAYANLGRVKDKYAITVDSVVNNPAGTFKSFNHRYQVSIEEAKLVEEAFNKEPGNTMYNVIQAYTRAANATCLLTSDLESSFKLQKIAGNILQLVSGKDKPALELVN